MAYEIIYVCNSKNNKNVRSGELEFLKCYPDKLYFEFGESENYTKKRYYDDLETLNKDYNALLKLKDSDKNEDNIITTVEEETETIEVTESEYKPIKKSKKRKSF